MPTLEEYMSNAMVTVGQALMIARSYVGRGDMVTEETFKWVATYPPIVKASCLIFRFMDDIASHEVLLYILYTMHYILTNFLVLCEIVICGFKSMFSEYVK